MRGAGGRFYARAAAGVVAALLACAGAGPGKAALVRSPFMPVGAVVGPPYGYFEYCHRKSSACAEFDGASSARQSPAASGSAYWDLVFNPESGLSTGPKSSDWVMADLTPDQWREVSDINRRVNGEISAEDDEQQYHRRDFWTLPFRRRGRMHGDCEDYVLQKRAELIEAGVPEGSLSIAIAETPRRETHAVLLIATPAGEFVLDNRSEWISRWYDLNYRWERRQIPGSQSWVRVAPGGGSI